MKIDYIELWVRQLLKSIDAVALTELPERIKKAAIAQRKQLVKELRSKTNA